MVGKGMVPLVRAPAGACDTHMHVFGAREKYPSFTTERYVPPYAPLEGYLAEMRPVGIERIVVVQPSAYGYDNSCTLDALRTLGSAGRGIVHLPEDVTDRAFDAMHALGVRGARVNTSPIKKPEAGYARSLLPQIRRLAERLEGTGWCIEFLTPDWLTEELFPVMQELKVDFILDHFGLFRAAEGAGQPGFRKMLKLVEGGRGWLKLTGLYRLSIAPGLADVEPFFRTVAKACPERLLWGSDYPHLSFADTADTIELYNLFCRWIDDAAVRRRILVDNPAELFGFSRSLAEATAT